MRGRWPMLRADFVAGDACGLRDRPHLLERYTLALPLRDSAIGNPQLSGEPGQPKLPEPIHNGARHGAAHFNGA
jgi:hypothetical protein